MMQPNVAVPMPSSVKPPSVSLKLPAPRTSATATVMRLRACEKSTRFSTQMRPAVAAIIAILLGFSPKFGALILTIPGPVLGGLSIVVFGLIAVTAGRIWVENRVDFSDARNLVTVAVALVLGAGNFKLSLGGFTLDGIGTATFGCIILYHLLNAGRREKVI